MIDLFPNETLPVMLGIYLIVLFALNALVFRPTLKLLEERGNRTGLLKDESAKLALEAKSLAARYEKQALDARREAATEREKIVSDARKEEAIIIAQARAEGDKLLAQMRQSLNGEREAAKATMKQLSDELARGITGKVLERNA